MAMILPVTAAAALLLLAAGVLVGVQMYRKRKLAEELAPWGANVPQMMAQPATQGGWVDQSAWEQQFVLHNSQPMDQQAIQAAIMNNNMMAQQTAMMNDHLPTQMAMMNNGMMAPVTPQGLAMPSDDFLTVPMQTEVEAPPDSYGQPAAPAYAYEEPAPAQAQQYVSGEQPRQEPEDPFLEAMMHQAQMGIFAQPDKEPQGSPV